MSARDTKRFAFGRNWQAFLNILDEERILQAEAALKSPLARGAFRKKPKAGTGPCAA
jgi:hypothetical protein